jgi:hypothetical protein
MWEKMRKLIDGTEASELNEPISLIVKTKCPNKYLLLDLETDETYRGTDNNQPGSHWTKIDNSFVNEFKKLNPKPAATAINVREILDAVDALLKL